VYKAKRDLLVMVLEKADEVWDEVYYQARCLLEPGLRERVERVERREDDELEDDEPEDDIRRTRLSDLETSLGEHGQRLSALEAWRQKEQVDKLTKKGETHGPGKGVSAFDFYTGGRGGVGVACPGSAESLGHQADAHQHLRSVRPVGVTATQPEADGGERGDPVLEDWVGVAVQPGGGGAGVDGASSALVPAGASQGG